MKRISLFILLAIAGINTCGAMSPKNTKINPAIVAATTKLQAKPIVFFDIKELEANRDYETGYLKTPPKSDEINDIEKQMYQFHQSNQAIQKEQQDKMNAARLQYDNKQITHQAWIKAQEDANRELVKGTNENNSKNNSLALQRQAVSKKIVTICTTIAQKVGACAFRYYSSNADHCEQFLCMCVDPAYDITQEVFDTLNREYKESKTIKSSCNQSCCVHCPLKNRQH